MRKSQAALIYMGVKVVLVVLVVVIAVVLIRNVVKGAKTNLNSLIGKNLGGLITENGITYRENIDENDLEILNKLVEGYSCEKIHSKHLSDPVVPGTIINRIYPNVDVILIDQEKKELYVFKRYNNVPILYYKSGINKNYGLIKIVVKEDFNGNKAAFGKRINKERIIISRKKDIDEDINDLPLEFINKYGEEKIKKNFYKIIVDNNYFYIIQQNNDLLIALRDDHNAYNEGDLEGYIEKTCKNEKK